jgi:hypothetical protein
MNDLRQEVLMKRLLGPGVSIQKREGVAPRPSHFFFALIFTRLLVRERSTTQYHYFSHSPTLAHRSNLF